MDMRENPNYYTANKPYKSKHICVNCRKAFKRRVLSDINGNLTDEKEHRCPDCGNTTLWIGPKFRPPKSGNLKAWNSIGVLQSIGALDFLGWASETVEIPETKKSLADMLTEMKERSKMAIRQWTTTEYAENNKEQIQLFSDFVKRIDDQLKNM